ncbi:hypothetical protein RCH07_002649 [Arthrobacter sp. CG_A4]|nr:hypothetical protein [Arthrobacter sp. CG_A4]
MELNIRHNYFKSLDDLARATGADSLATLDHALIH